MTTIYIRIGSSTILIVIVSTTFDLVITIIIDGIIRVIKINPGEGYRMGL